MMFIGGGMVASWLWLSLGLGLLLVFIYPYLIYPIILSAFPKQPYTPDTATAVSHLSAALLFCAFNEEQSLPKKIENIRALKRLHPDLEVLAYSDCSEDRTNEILLDATDVLTPVLGKSRTGKVIGMQKLVSATNADIVIFTDANVILEPKSLTRLLQYFTHPEIGSVAGTLLYVSDDISKTTATEKVGGLYWKLEEKIKRLESETGSMMGADGAIFARRRDNYPQLPGHLVDDMATSISVIFDGLRCVSAPDVIAYEQSVTASAEEFSRKRRIACGSINTYWYLLPQLGKMSLMDRFKFFSHKTIRWAGAFILLAAVLCLWIGGAMMGYSALVMGALIGGVIMLQILGSLGVPLFSTVYEVLLAIVATGIGVLEAFVGTTYQTWTPSKSR
jgi:cellulose synthase/poly-beta-1,6-N-acetylglucosamine synthase-like glycosyltransferase